MSGKRSPTCRNTAQLTPIASSHVMNQQRGVSWPKLIPRLFTGMHRLDSRTVANLEWEPKLASALTKSALEVPWVWTNSPLINGLDLARDRSAAKLSNERDRTRS